MTTKEEIENLLDIEPQVELGKAYLSSSQWAWDEAGDGTAIFAVSIPRRLRPTLGQELIDLMKQYFPDLKEEL